MQFSSTFMRNIAYGILGLLAIVIMVSSFTIKNNIINSVFGVSNVKAFNDNKNNYATFGSVKEGFFTSDPEYIFSLSSGYYKKAACDLIKDFNETIEPSRGNMEDCEKKTNYDIKKRLGEIKKLVSDIINDHKIRIGSKTLKHINKSSHKDSSEITELKEKIAGLEIYEKHIDDTMKKIK